MRLWSLHPSYLDPQGLVAVWREGLLARNVLEGRTKGYRNHPQLARFAAADSPLCSINAYLEGIYREAELRCYRFDRSKITVGLDAAPIEVTSGQLLYEWEHLMGKLRSRSPDLFNRRASVDVSAPVPHPLFMVVPGGIAAWEKITEAPGDGVRQKRGRA